MKHEQQEEEGFHQHHLAANCKNDNICWIFRNDPVNGFWEKNLFPVKNSSVRRILLGVHGKARHCFYCFFIFLNNIYYYHCLPLFSLYFPAYFSCLSAYYLWYAFSKFSFECWLNLGIHIWSNILSLHLLNN